MKMETWLFLLLMELLERIQRQATRYILNDYTSE